MRGEGGVAGFVPEQKFNSAGAKTTFEKGGGA